MKILELTNYSAGICGVFQRVKQESIELSKLGHEVVIFSSDKTKGSKEIAPSNSTIGKIRIQRFKSKKLGGESFLSWNFLDEAVRFKPDIVIAHAYRHRHTIRALKLKKLIGCKVFLVTHAPFIDSNSTRGALSKLIVPFYDKFVGKHTINKFDKIISITHWEEKYLEELNVDKNKIIYIPNGIPKEFFKKRIIWSKSKNILFLGRISPIKNLEILVQAMSFFSDKDISLTIIGAPEEPYASKIQEQIKKLNLSDKISFLPPVYDLEEKIKFIQDADIFVLPSLREAMPQSLIEAMSLGKIVIASRTKGAEEVISNLENGILFEIGSAQELYEKIGFVLNKKNYTKILEIQKTARKSVEKFNWDVLIKKLTSLF